MAYPPRLFRDDRFYRVRNYCCEGQPFFRHTPETHRIITDLLCKYAARRNIGVLGVVFMPAYFDMILIQPDLNLDAFMRDFQGQVARELGAYWGRSGPFFVGRYEESEIDPDRLLDAYVEMLCLPVSEDYVAHPEKWPGLSTWAATLGERSLVGTRQDRKIYWKMRRRKNNEALSDAEIEAMATETFEVNLVKLPEWAHLNAAVYAEKLEAKVAQKIEALRAFKGDALCGPNSAAKHPCQVRPGVKRHRLPHLTTGSTAALAAHRARRKAAVKQYRKAAKRLRCGWKKAYFPVGMFPPGHLHAVGSPGARAAGEDRGAPEAATSKMPGEHAES